MKKLWKLGLLSILLIGAFTACESPEQKLKNFVKKAWNPAKDSMFATHKTASTTINFTEQSVKEMGESGLYTRYLDTNTQKEFVEIANKQKGELQLQTIMFQDIKTMVQLVEQQDLAFEKSFLPNSNPAPDFEALKVQGKLLADSCLKLRKKYSLAFTQSRTAAYNNKKYFKEQLELELALYQKQYAQQKGK